MICPYCRSKDIMVVDSRDVDEKSVRRRRACASCGKRFTTYERMESAGVLVVKRDSRREQFDRNKIVGGIARACEKRPVSAEKIDWIADRVELKIRDMGTNEVASGKIGDLVMTELLKVDSVAYIRFASVYKQFDSPSEFVKVISILKSGGK